MPASVFAAAKNISSVTRVASLVITPSPTPGKTYELLLCPGTKVFPLYVTGSNGLPLAYTARPSDHVYASTAVHSDFEVGFERAKMIGRWFMRAIASTIGLVNIPGVPETPMMAVGVMASTACRKSPMNAWSCAKGRWWGARSVRLLTMSPLMSTYQHLRFASV